MAKGSSGDARIERRVWIYDYKYFNVMREAMQYRARLVPYTYSSALQSHYNGVPFIRSLYVDYIDAVAHLNDTDVNGLSVVNTSYLFGDMLLVAPIITPINIHTNLSTRSVYLPKGTAASTGVMWVEKTNGRCVA